MRGDDVWKKVGDEGNVEDGEHVAENRYRSEEEKYREDEMGSREARRCGAVYCGILPTVGRREAASGPPPSSLVDAELDGGWRVEVGKARSGVV